MHRHPSDDEVAALPLSAGRAELLEQIMSTPVRDAAAPATDPDRGPRRRRWLVPLAAAACVVALALAVSVPLGRGGLGGNEGNVGDREAASADPQRVFAVLDAPGWQVAYADATSDGGSIEYRSGQASLAIGSVPVSLYEARVTDRSRLADPPGPGDPVVVDGVPAQVWAYNASDHTAIREPQDGQWSELRGQGLDRADFDTLLGQVRFVDRAAYESSLPERFVTTAERDGVVRDMVEGIRDALAPEHGLTPTGVRPTFSTTDTSRYGLMTSVAGTVACGWAEQYSAARSAGDTSSMADAARALATSRSWPVLQEFESEGDYPEVVWKYADEMAAGQDVRGYRMGLGCE